MHDQIDGSDGGTLSALKQARESLQQRESSNLNEQIVNAWRNRRNREPKPKHVHKDGDDGDKDGKDGQDGK